VATDTRFGASLFGTSLFGASVFGASLRGALRGAALVAVVAGASILGSGCGARIVDDVVFVGDDNGDRDGDTSGEGEGDPGGEGEGEDRSDLVDVGHPRELRGAWVATVYGINFPTDRAAPATAKEAELRTLIAGLADNGINALFFQVRPESDALYASSLEPWSRFLTGTQGADPGFDPLAVALSEAHARGVEVHAWLNPYRGLTSASVTAAPDHPTRTLAAHAIAYDGGVWMDPGAPAVRAHVVAVIEDLVGRYDVDGIHFDDYFYPYPGAEPFPDDDSYDAFVASGGNRSRSDWRRDNVNALVRDVADALGAHPAVRFGISPFGIYRPGTPAGIVGLDAYEDISCDAVTWLANDWVDYLAPQLYWPTTQTAQAFGTLLPWWASLTDGDGRFVAAGMNLNAVDDWGVDEIVDQLDIVAAHRDEGAAGSIFYHAAPLLDDVAGVATRLAAGRFGAPALPPPVVADPRVPAPPAVVVDGNVVALPAVDVAVDRGFALYRATSPAAGSAFALARLIDADTATVTLTPGRYAVTTVGKNDRESRGVVVDIR
jgi:uncharacterized lipoprotein YddW (UPF0748 family)